MFVQKGLVIFQTDAMFQSSWLYIWDETETLAPIQTLCYVVLALNELTHKSESIQM